MKSAIVSFSLRSLRAAFTLEMFAPFRTIGIIGGLENSAEKMTAFEYSDKKNGNEKLR
jgi:hypothetical protein